MTKRHWQDDEEIRRALDGAPRHFSLTKLAAMLRAMFGPNRAPSKSAIARDFAARHIAKPKPSKLDRDAELRAFVEARLAAGDTLDEIVTEGQRRFGPRMVGRSSVDRHRSRLRLEKHVGPLPDRPGKGRKTV